ncbi:MAG: hypothetical protein JW955_07825 [Sedimentisphaerales bacterium]|nr:hypothetical protein [Sedimentisphaerales bacterium]
MRPETTNRRRYDRVSFGLFATAVLLGALAVGKVASVAQTQRLIAQVRSLGRQDPNDLQASVRKAQESAEALKKSNLFVKQAPKEHPVKQVDGILGSEVLIAGEWYKVGEKVGDARIVGIAPTEVTIEWDGRKKAFAPLAAASAAEEPRKPGPGKPEAAKASEPAKPVPQAAPAEVREVAAPAENDPLAWMGVSLSPKLREKLLARWNSASDEEKERAKQEWNKMPEAEKQRAIDMMDQAL